MSAHTERRRWIILASAAVASTAVLAGAKEKDDDDDDIDVTAAEDLMREHGVLRRALLVYAEAATRLATGGNVPLDALAQVATLFRSFGEDYHERSLEEKHVFVPLMKSGGKHAALARTLVDQHERGRQVTDYVAAIARKGRIPDNASFATVLASFVRMYQHHAAIEDTVIFPAWKQAISPAQYRELNEEFEDLEHKMFGKDGFEDAVQRVGKIEESFGLANLAALTPPAPPMP